MFPIYGFDNSLYGMLIYFFVAVIFISERFSYRHITRNVSLLRIRTVLEPVNALSCNFEALPFSKHATFPENPGVSEV